MKDLSLTAPWSQEKQRLIWKGLMLTWSQWGSVRGHDWVAGPARWPLWWPAFFFTGAFFLARFTSSALAYILQNHSRHQMLPQLVFVHWVTRERESEGSQKVLHLNLTPWKTVSPSSVFTSRGRQGECAKEKLSSSLKPHVPQVLPLALHLDSSRVGRGSCQTWSASLSWWMTPSEPQRTPQEVLLENSSRVFYCQG